MRRVRAYPPPEKKSYSIEDLPPLIMTAVLFIGLLIERGWL